MKQLSFVERDIACSGDHAWGELPCENEPHPAVERVLCADWTRHPEAAADLAGGDAAHPLPVIVVQIREFA